MREEERGASGCEAGIEGKDATDLFSRLRLG